MSSFFVIRHAFKFGKADEWWAAVNELQTSGKMAAWAEAAKGMGFVNHTMIATGHLSPAFCIWEAEEGKTGEDMQTFIDGEHGPSFGCLLNEVFQISGDLAGTPPFPRAFGAEAKEPAAHASSDSPLFLVQHTFKPGMAAQWWGEFGQLAAEPEKMAAWTATVEAAGFHNHCFMPSGQATDAFCLWEAQPGTTAAQMQAFIDGPLGPSFGCFTNKVMLVDEARSNVAAVERKFTEHTVLARFTPAEGKHEELLKVFTDVLPGTVSGAHGNNLIEAYVDPATKDIVLYEKWATKGHFERYLAFRTEDGTFAKILALVANPPHIMHLHRELDGEARNNVLNAGHTVCAKFVAQEGQRAELMQIFANVYPVTFGYEGNRHLSMYTDPEDANAFYLWEQWTEPKAFEAYFAFRVGEGFIDKISPMLGAPPQPAPLELRWQNKEEASTVKVTLDKAKATDAALRLASPSHAGAVPPASPKKLRTTTA